MGDVGLKGAASEAGNPYDRNRIASTGWARWTPVSLGAIAAHLVGRAAITVANRQRLSGQQGVATTSIVKTLLTGAALTATGLPVTSARSR
jgi:hypothetical protein